MAINFKEHGLDDKSIVASMIADAKKLGMEPEEIDDHVKQAAYTLVVGKSFQLFVNLVIYCCVSVTDVQVLWIR